MKIPRARPSSKISRCSCVAFVMLLLFAGTHVALPAWPLDIPERRIVDFHHTAWTAKDGAPIDVWAMAQTADGWIWFGAPSGLYRFDGVRFERVDLDPSNPDRAKSISTLLALESGELWIGYVYGGASILKDGRFTHYDESHGIGGGTTVTFEQDAEGAIWAACANALLRFDGEHWHRIGADWGFADAYAYSIFLDQQGTLFVSGEAEIWSLPQGKRTFERTGLKHIDQAEFLQSPDGRVWYSDTKGVHALPGQQGTTPRKQWRNSRTSYVTLFGHDGSLWSVAGSDGLGRLADPWQRSSSWLHDAANRERFSQRDGLTNIVAKTIMEDREGNLWLSTVTGIDRFRHMNVRRLRERPAEAMVALAPAEDGAIWFGAKAGLFDRSLTGLWKFDGKLHRYEEQRLGILNAVHRRGDRLWVGGANGVWRSDGTRFDPLPLLPEGARGQDVHALTVDAHGDPWVSVNRSSLFRFKDGAWQVNGGYADLPPRRSFAQSLDARGRMWFGYDDSTVYVLDNDTVVRYGKEQGLRVGVVTSIHTGRHTLVGGRAGWAIFDGARFHRLQYSSDPLALEGVTGVHEMDNGDVWFAGMRGAGRVSSAMLARAASGEPVDLQLELFGVDDGFPGFAQQLRPLPSLIEATDGRLWFAGNVGIAWIDPQHIRRNAVPPSIVVTSVVADERRFELSKAMTLAAGTRSLEIDYSALSYSRPEAIRFRYRLEGFDDRWIEAGSRRQAFYTNLEPGTYAFRVTAANEHGLWNETPTEITLVLPPTFTQTWAFVVLCVAAASALLWLAYILHLRQITARERHRAEARLMERERIARDLHDTLLQGVQALILKFNSVIQQLPVYAPLRTQLDDAVNRAEELLAEGRDRVKALRTTRERTDLAHAIRALYDSMAPDSSTTLHLADHGHSRPLNDAACAEIELIVGEALSNVLRHARASRIDVEIQREPKELVVRIQDDGCGMDERTLTYGREGHFGFVGMRERAARIGAAFAMSSHAGHGTRIELRVPARTIYSGAVTNE